MPQLHPDTKRVAVLIVATLAVCIWMADISFRVGALYALLLVAAGTAYYYIRRISSLTAGILLLALTGTLWVAINMDFEIGAIASIIIILSMIVAHEMGFTKNHATRTLYGIDENWEVDLPVSFGIGVAYIALISMVPSISMTVPSPDMLSGLADHTFYAMSAEYLIVVCLLAPVSEECVFRGVLFPAFSQLFGDDLKGMIGGGLVLAVIISSIAFSLFHWSAYGAVFMEGAFVGAFIFGVLMCAVAYWQKSILGCILIHTMTNAWIVQDMFAVIQ